MTDDQQNQAAEADPEMVFRAVRQTILDQQEQEINQLRADAEAGEAVSRRVDDPVRQLWERSGLDMAAINELREAETATMTEYVEEFRRRAAARDPQRGPRLRAAAEHALVQIQAGGSQPYLIGGDVVAGSPDQLAGYEGEPGNPATWLYDAAKNLDVKSSATGSPGCWAGHTYNPVYVTWHYLWPAVAQEVGNCSVQAWFGYHGYYQLLAVPLPPDYCQWAGATATATLQVFQYGTDPRMGIKMLGKQETKFFYKTVGSVGHGLPGAGTVSSGFLEGSDVLTTDVKITSLSEIHIAFTVKVNAGAQGQPAYAEINFQDGDAHYLPPPFLIISWEVYPPGGGTWGKLG